MYQDPKGKYQLRPLGPKYAKQDYAAYMSSIEHLQQTFTFSKSWPHANLTMEEAVKDVEGEIKGFEARRKFTYAVLTPDESIELGCVYVSPSPKEGYDAQVRIWVIASEAKTGFEKTLYTDVRAWLKAAWPFSKVAFIGHEVSRDDYQKLPPKPRA